MKSFTSFFSLLSLVFFCFATGTSTAQSVNAMPNYYTTPQGYETAATAGFGDNLVVVFQKPTLEIRMSAYTVSSTGAVTQTDVYDYGAAKKVNVTMLSATRAVITYVSTTSKHHTAIFDLSATGTLALKHDLTGQTNIENVKPGLARLTGSSFATAIATQGGSYRISSFSVASNGTITKKADNNGTSITTVDLARMSENRVVATMKTTANSAKAICFDVNETTQAITRRGEVSLGTNNKRITTSPFATNMLVVFSTDSNNRLDARSYNVNSSGNFILKTNLNDMKKPGTTQYLQIAYLDGHLMNSVGKLMLGTSSTDAEGNKLSVLPFSYNTSTGAIALLNGGYYPNDPAVNFTYAGAANGFFIVSSRQMDNKYRIRAYKWEN